MKKLLKKALGILIIWLVFTLLIFGMVIGDSTNHYSVVKNLVCSGLCSLILFGGMGIIVGAIGIVIYLFEED